MIYPFANYSFLPIPKLERESENPFFVRLKRIEEIAADIRASGERFQKEQEKLQIEIHTLSGKIRQLFNDSWFGKNVGRKEAIRLMNIWFDRLRSVPTFGDDADMKMDLIETIKAKIIERKKIKTVLDELTVAEEKNRASLVEKRNSFAKEYVSFHGENSRKFDWLSCDMQLTIKGLYNEYVEPYLNQAIDLFKPKRVVKTLEELKGIANGLVDFREKHKLLGERFYPLSINILQTLEEKMNDLYTENSEEELWENTEVNEMLKKIEALKSQIKRLQSEMRNLDTVKRVEYAAL
jgi:hypothetical protein